MEFNKEEWLKTLKAGDKVANKVKNYNDIEAYYKFYEVKNITPKGQIRLTNGILLNEKGEYHKFERFSSTHYCIEPITNEILQYEKDKKRRTELYLEVRGMLEKKAIECKSWSIERLENVKKFLEDIDTTKTE